MFQDILVPVDFTQKNWTALQAVERLATKDGARVTLLHVIEKIDYAEDAEVEQFYESLEAKAQANLAEMVTSLSESGVTAKPKILFGRRGAEIVRHAIENQNDLIVLSSHQVDPDQGAAGWATLSYQVSILCPCPVLLVK